MSGADTAAGRLARTCSPDLVAGFRRGIIIILPNLWLNDVPILKSDIVEHSAACNYLRHEGRAHFHGLKENRSPACFHHPESSLDDVPGTGVLAVKASL